MFKNPVPQTPIPNSRRLILRDKGEEERMWKNHTPNSIVGSLFQGKEKGKGWKNRGNPSPPLWNVFNTLAAAFKTKPGDWKQAKILKSSFSKCKTELGMDTEVIYKFTEAYQKVCVLKNK